MKSTEKREWVILPSGVKIGLKTEEEKKEVRAMVKARINPTLLEGLREARAKSKQDKK